MDSSGVFLALEEQRKWRERRTRIEERLKQIARRRVYTLRELEHVRKKITGYARILGEPGPTPQSSETALSSQRLLR
ncbi:MAG TPA: hypothetical protein VJN63_04525 [Thermoplasmata archaeon]|nr:hypothetical protein [Thermoplasmata archaeon]